MPSAKGHDPGKPRRWRQLENFVVGPCNRVAQAAALGVAEAPGQEANPLVLHGPVGTGKTHLLEGMHVELRRRHPGLRVSYLTAEEFTNRFLGAMRLGKMAGFRKTVRDLDVLLLDDLQFLAKKTATQEEFLHTFDALHASERQIVVTCDCHPRLADQLAPELADRLLGGTIWSLAPPDLQTRKELVRKKATHPGETPWPKEVVDLVADHLRGNVRELEGAVHTLRHWARVTGRPLDVALAREAVGELLRHSVRVHQVMDVDRAVCQVLGLEAGALQSKHRGWKVSHPRMLAIFLARRHTSATYTEIGQRLGGRNHSTAVAAEKKVRSWLADNACLKFGRCDLRVSDLVERIERELMR